MFAGSIILSPAFTIKGVPLITMFADPSSICMSASNGARCSLNSSPLPKENRVIFPEGVLINCLLMIPPSEYSMRDVKWSIVPF